MDVRRKLVAFGAGLLLAGLALGVGGTSTAKTSPVGPVPAQGMTTTTTAPAPPPAPY